MRIDIKSLHAVESVYKDQDLSLFAIRTMLANVIEFGVTSYKLAPDNVKMAILTLKELNILVDDDEPKSKPLNS